MRISDWSSDVCSSDLRWRPVHRKIKSHPMILVIDNYDSFTWNLVHYLQEMGVAVEVARNDRISVGQAMSGGAEGFLISPGPCTPTEAGISLELVQACAADKRPLPGVRAEERRVWKAVDSTVKSRRST